MSPLRLIGFTFALFLALASLTGCKKDVPPPAPLAVEEFAPAFDKAFAKANAEVKDLAAQVVTAVKAQDYPKAFAQVQALTAAPGLTKDQQALMARALLKVNELLATAQSQGDAQATQTLETYRRNK